MATAAPPLVLPSDEGVEAKGGGGNAAAAAVRGWLLKLGGAVKIWKKRFCVVQNGYVFYFKVGHA